jgi:hypothetical protein
VAKQPWVNVKVGDKHCQRGTDDITTPVPRCHPSFLMQSLSRRVFACHDIGNPGNPRQQNKLVIRMAIGVCQCQSLVETGRCWHARGNMSAQLEELTSDVSTNDLAWKLVRWKSLGRRIVPPFQYCNKIRDCCLIVASIGFEPSLESSAGIYLHANCAYVRYETHILPMLHLSVIIYVLVWFVKSWIWHGCAGLGTVDKY